MKYVLKTLFVIRIHLFCGRVAAGHLVSGLNIFTYVAVTHEDILEGALSSALGWPWCEASTKLGTKDTTT